MTIDEAIKEEQTLYDIAKDKYEKLGIKNCLKRMEEHKQYIEWLEELKEYKEHEFDILKKDGQLLYKQGVLDGYNKAIDDFIHECDKYCGYYKGENKNLTRECMLMIAEKIKAVE